jgi:hypothetical protein
MDEVPGCRGRCDRHCLHFCLRRGGRQVGVGHEHAVSDWHSSTIGGRKRERQRCGRFEQRRIVVGGIGRRLGGG